MRRVVTFLRSLGSFVLAVVFRYENIISNRKKMLLLILGWTFALPLGTSIGIFILRGWPSLASSRITKNLIEGLIQGILICVVLFLALRNEDIVIRRRGLFWLTLSWGIPWAVYWAFPPSVTGLLDSNLASRLTVPINQILQPVLGAFVGAVYALVLFRQVRGEKN